MKFVLPIVFVFFAFTGCQKNNAQITASVLSITDTLPSRQDLRNYFRDKREVLVVYGAKEESLKEQYEELLNKLVKQVKAYRRSINLTYLEASLVKEQDLENKTLYLIGSPKNNDWIKKLSVNLPINFSDRGISFLKKELREPDDLISILFFPNPENNKIPFSFLSGNNDQEIFDFFEQKAIEGRPLFWQNMDYEIYNAKNRIIMGNFGTRWIADKKTHFDYSIANDTIYNSTHFDYITHQNATFKNKVETLASEIEKKTLRVLSFIHSDSILPKFYYHIYKTAEDKGLITGNTDRSHINMVDNSIHTVINDKYINNNIEKENNLLIQHLLPDSKLLLFKKGLPIYFTNKWQREGYQYWAARLFESGNSNSFKELLDNTLMEQESPLIYDCMAGTAVSFLIEKWGKDKFLTRYNDWSPKLSELAELEIQWKNYLLKLTDTHKKKARQKRGFNYLKGFNFAQEGFGIYNGYMSKKASESLLKQKSLGANAIAIVPYSFMRSDTIPNHLSISNGAGSENDEGIIHSTFEAQKLGMKVLLKPQIFIGNSWPGAIEMKNESDWGSFFKYYYKWIRHYAFLSEIYEIDMLSIGVEFAIATLTHEEEWRNIFKKVRGLYQGQLTYSANWGDEFEKVQFWDELDFIGLNSYYPLSKKDNPTDEELKENFEIIKQKINRVYQKFQKPIVFTEIGFRSINEPWKNPHAGGDDSFNEVHQKRSYEVIFEGIQNEPWSGGILWWKFPSYIEYKGKQNDSFSPNNKITEKVIKKWFLQ